MRITLGNINGKTYGLNASEACVYAAIEKCSRGDNAKGWYGTMEALAAVLPFKVGRMSVSRAIAKLLTLGLVKEEGEKLYANAQNEQNDAQNEQNDAQNEQNDAQNEHKNAQNDLPPNNPPIYNKKMKNEISSTHTPTRDATNPDPSFEVFKDLFIQASERDIDKEQANKWFYYRGAFAEEFWAHSSSAKKAAIIDDLKACIARNNTPFKSNPQFYLQDFPEPEPTNYNGARSLPDEPLVIATYREIGGIYTEREAKLFGMNIIKPFKP